MVDKKLAEWLRSHAEHGYFSIESREKLVEWAEQVERQHTGLDPEMGFLLEGANEGEIAAYDHGCAEAQAWLDGMLDKPLDACRAGGHGQPKINEQRDRIIALREKAEGMVQVGWRWIYADGTPSGLFYGTGPVPFAFEMANSGRFGPVKVQTVYVFPTNGIPK